MFTVNNATYVCCYFVNKCRFCVECELRFTWLAGTGDAYVVRPHLIPREQRCFWLFLLHLVEFITHVHWTQLHVNVYITQPTSWPHVASPTWSSTEQVARPATKRFQTSDWRAPETCCRPWTWWCNDATALAGYANLMMMMFTETF